MSTPAPPLTVVGGYLGAGKTTLLNHLLGNTEGLRIAFVVNDFGDVNIDAELIAAAGAETIALANGCICCTLFDGLATVLAGLRERADLDHIVVEASGVSDPLKLGQCGAAFGFGFLGVIVLVDAARVRQLAMDKYVGEAVIRQLQCADLLILNKTDLVAAEELASVRQWLFGVVPDAGMVDARHGRVPPSVVLGPNRGAASHVDDTDASSHPEYESWSFDVEKPLARSDIEAFLAELPAGVLRVKGFVRLTEDSEHQYLLQAVGQRWELTPHDAPGAEPATNRVVIIGTPGTNNRPLLAKLLNG